MSPTLFGMLAPMSCQRSSGTIEPIDAAVILLVQPVGQRRVLSHAVRVVAEWRRWLRQKGCFDAGIERAPIGPRHRSIRTRLHSTCRYTCGSIARVDEYGMQRRTVGRAVLVAAAPRLAHRMLVESIDAAPCRAAIVGSKQSLRRSAGVPHARLRSMSGRKPESVVDDSSATFAKGWRAASLRAMCGPGQTSGKSSARDVPCARRASIVLRSRGSATQ